LLTLQVEVQARADQAAALELFLNWVKAVRPDAEGINPGSGTQIQTLLFGGAKGERSNEELIPATRVFQIDKEPEELAAIEAAKDAYSDMTAVQLKAACVAAGLKGSGTKAALLSRLRGTEPHDPSAEFKAMAVKDLRETALGRGLSSEGTKAQLVKRLTDDTLYLMSLDDSNSSSSSSSSAAAAEPPVKVSKYRDVTITSLGITPLKFTKTGLPAVSMDVLRGLAGSPTEDPPKYGPAFEHFHGGDAGRDACLALDALCKMGSIDTMLSTFLLPLQTLIDERSRVHCSLNINTETGRLSSRRPNLQNQPALEKDQYKIRYAFQVRHYSHY
jgi:DNA polymerase family A/SAP domain